MPPKRKAAEKSAETSEKETTKKTKASSSEVTAEAPAKKVAAGKLAVGSKLPSGLEVINEEEKTFQLTDLCQDNGIVIFFYPKANTPGCTKQACGFRDNYETFEKKGYKVYGMSADSPTSQLNWKKKYNLPYHLLSDRSKDRAVLKALGVNKAPSSVSRSHLVIGKGGVLEQILYGISPGVSVDEATDFVKSK